MFPRFATYLKAVLALIFLAAPVVANGQTVRYRVVPLPEVQTAQTSCVPTAINDNGDVVGYCNAGSLESFAVIWRRSTGGVENLGKWDPKSTFSHAYGINSSGQIVGDSDDGDFSPKAMVRRGNVWIEVDNSGGSAQYAYGITDDGVILGNFTTQGGSIGTIDWDPVAWVYDAAHDRYDRIDLPKPPANPQPAGVPLLSGAFIWAASKSGYAAGDVTSDIVGNQAGLWNNDASRSLVVLGLPAGGFLSALAYGVSDDGRAVGVASNGASGLVRAVLWQNDAAHTAIDLGTLPGDTHSGAYGVNTAGHVVGVSRDSLSSIGKGFIYQNGTMTELTTLLRTTDGAWTINEPAGINDAGLIIATGTLNGVRHPVMLVPFVPPISSLSLTADHAAPQAPGTSITFTAQAAGGSAPYQFRFWLYDGTTWTIGQDWSEAMTFTWTPTTGNTYQVWAFARSAGNTSDAAEAKAGTVFPILNRITGVTFTANLAAPQAPGTGITFTAAATGGVGPLQFKWWIYNGTAWTIGQDWSTATSFTWTPTANGTYQVWAFARSAGSTTDAAEQMAGVLFAIQSPVTAVTLTADRTSPQQPGTSITFTAAATGGAGPEFKWWLFDGTTWTVGQNWSTATSFTWTPATGTYQVWVFARSAGSTVDAPEQMAGTVFAIRSAQ